MDTVKAVEHSPQTRIVECAKIHPIELYEPSQKSEAVEKVLVGPASTMSKHDPNLDGNKEPAKVLPLRAAPQRNVSTSQLQLFKLYDKVRQADAIKQKPK